jgi:hypothetical protein
MVSSSSSADVGRAGGEEDKRSMVEEGLGGRKTVGRGGGRGVAGGLDGTDAAEVELGWILLLGLSREEQTGGV